MPPHVFSGHAAKASRLLTGNRGALLSGFAECRREWLVSGKAVIGRTCGTGAVGLGGVAPKRCEAIDGAVQRPRKVIDDSEL